MLPGANVYFVATLCKAEPLGTTKETVALHTTPPGTQKCRTKCINRTLNQQECLPYNLPKFTASHVNVTMIFIF